MQIWKPLKNTLTNKDSLTSHEPKGIGVLRHYDKNDEVYWKEMSESVGPNTINKCPKVILDMLTPIDKLNYPGYAKEWRESQLETVKS